MRYYFGLSKTGGSHVVPALRLKEQGHVSFPTQVCTSAILISRTHSARVLVLRRWMSQSMTRSRATSDCAQL